VNYQNDADELFLYLIARVEEEQNEINYDNDDNKSFTSIFQVLEEFI